MPDDDLPPRQVWELTVAGQHHRIETRGSQSRRLRWLVDGTTVAERRSSDEKVRLSAKDRPELGVVAVRFSGFGRPQRATLLEPGGSRDAKAGAAAGLGGVDLEPAPGSPAARHEATVRAHPRRYAALAGLAGVGRIVIPLLAAAVFAWLGKLISWSDLPRIPLPNLPEIHLPWPDLPDISWPDLPSIPWPDWTLPEWVSDLAWLVHLVWPVAIGLVVASAEVRRRRRQDRLRADRADRAGADRADGPDSVPSPLLKTERDPAVDPDRGSAEG